MTLFYIYGSKLYSIVLNHNISCLIKKVVISYFFLYFMHLYMFNIFNTFLYLIKKKNKKHTLAVLYSDFLIIEQKDIYFIHEFIIERWRKNKNVLLDFCCFNYYLFPHANENFFPSFFLSSKKNLEFRRTVYSIIEIPRFLIECIVFYTSHKQTKTK